MTSPRAVAPPPTRYGKAPAASVQPKGAAPSRTIAPPPTKFGAAAPVRPPLPAAPKARSAQAKAPPKAGGGTASRVVQRAAAAVVALAWPASISAGPMTLTKVQNKLIYENDIKSGHAGHFHVTIHGADGADRSKWKPDTHPLHGRYYLTKQKQFGTKVESGVAVRDGWDPQNADEEQALAFALELTSEAYLRLRPFQPAAAGAHMHHTTTHKGTKALESTAK